MVFTAVQPAHCVQVSTYADDIAVFVKDQRDVDVVGDRLDVFGKASNAKVNWRRLKLSWQGSGRGLPPYCSPSL